MSDKFQMVFQLFLIFWVRIFKVSSIYFGQLYKVILAAAKFSYELDITIFDEVRDNCENFQSFLHSFRLIAEYLQTLD
jgi:hypothetical protein